MRRGLTIAQLGDLVEFPIVATLATYRADGSVLLSPVWHEYRDGGFNVATGSDNVKARHLRRDPRAVLLVAESVHPNRGVELTARASLSTDDVLGTVSRIAVRYLGEQKGREYVRTATDDVVVRLEPGQVRAWDFADMPF